jgi:hypothetical protein
MHVLGHLLTSFSFKQNVSDSAFGSVIRRKLYNLIAWSIDEGKLNREELDEGK